MKNGSVVVKCLCKNEFQDKTYGEGMRVATVTAKQNDVSKTADVRCTVCGKVHTVSQSTIK